MAPKPDLPGLKVVCSRKSCRRLLAGDFTVFKKQNSLEIGQLYKSVLSLLLFGRIIWIALKRLREYVRCNGICLVIIGRDKREEKIKVVLTVNRE